MIASSPPSTTNQAQPEPKRPAAAFANSSLKASKLPNLASIAEANSPVGVEDPPGVRISQNNEWLACPPPLLRTAVCLSAGRASMF